MMLPMQTKLAANHPDYPQRCVSLGDVVQLAGCSMLPELIIVAVAQ
ncbi:hypothetical protein PANA5342_2841 [Pantoea ananatis LMG 5342]|nr:hypothetical protein PANA5342_2841 [Pantoea ananatis LMG 5342]